MCCDLLQINIPSHSKFNSSQQSTISVDDTDGQTHDLANLYSFYTIWAYMWKSDNVYSSKCAAHRHQADLKRKSIFFSFCTMHWELLKSSGWSRPPLDNTLPVCDKQLHSRPAHLPQAHFHVTVQFLHASLHPFVANGTRCFIHFPFPVLNS